MPRFSPVLVRRQFFTVPLDQEGRRPRAEPSLGAQRHCSHRSRFPLGLFEFKAYTREIDDSIANTHIQHGLKRHPSIQIWKAQVYSLFSLSIVRSKCVDMHANW